jgi:hypothetical protein
LAPGGRTFAFAGGLLLAGVGILSLVPMAVVRRASPFALLAGRVGNILIGASRTRNAFLIGQIALTGCLLYMAGLMVHSQVRAETFDHGFDAEQVLVFWPPPTVRHSTSRDELRADVLDRDRMVRASVDRLNASTAVVAASDVSAIHLTGLPDPMEETISHFDGRVLHPVVRARSTGAGATFLAALGGTLLAGHTFGDAPYAGRQDVVVINETLASLLSPQVTVMGIDVRSRVIGAEIRTKFFQGEIVGIMKDLVDSSPALPAQPQMFISSRHPNYAAGIITINARVPLESTVPIIRSTLEEIWGPLPPRRFGLMNDELERALAPFRARSTLLSLIALLCLPLAAVGLTGALLLFVRSRERENAIRIALGAEPAAVRRAVVGRSLVMVALGLLPGIGLGAALANVVAHQLFNVYPIDPLTILLVGVSFLVLGWLAALVPSRRAFELQPAHLLRSN